MEELKERGHKAYIAKDYQTAIDLYSRAIEQAESASPTQLSVLYSNRSASYFCMGLYDSALEDADKAIELAPTWSKGFERRGTTLMAMKRFEQAQKAFSAGLLYDPHSEGLQKGIEQTEAELEKHASQKRKLAALTDDFDCMICMKMFFEPVTTSCGHSFCRGCLMKALDNSSACPLCRAVVHMTPDHAISVVLQNILQKNFPDEYKDRMKEVEEEKTQDLMALPLFLLNSVAFPEQFFHLHIFEPRYRLMIKRCLTGSRRFGLLCSTSSAPHGEDVGCILDIKKITILPDGRSYVETVGSNRFKIVDKWLQDGYACGKVQLISDKTSESIQQESIELVEEIQKRITEFVEEATNSRQALGEMTELVSSLAEMPGKENPEKFSFWVASKLPLSSAHSCQLLRCTNTAERLRSELDFINQVDTSSRDGPNCLIQ